MTVRVVQGDCRDVLRRLPAKSVHCVVTSPPYWGLRDYGVSGQLGQEVVHDCLGWASGHHCGACHVCHLVEVFRLVREALADDGTVWLNYGDSYNAGVAGRRKPSQTGKHGYWRNPHIDQRTKVGSLKPKDLVMMPARVALALQADGWWLRQDIIWHKRNPMPESVTDRCTKAHEYLFLLTKSKRYYFDQDAIKEPVSAGTHARRAGNGYKTPDGWDTSSGHGGHGAFHRAGREQGHVGYQLKRSLPGNRRHKGATAYAHGATEHRTKAGLVAYAEKLRKLARAGSGVKNNASMEAALTVMPATRNKRSVWSVATEPYREAHFATFPAALITPCVLAGCPAGGTVLDPFGGAGTTGLVADRLQRQALLIELNPAYVALARRRIASDRRARSMRVAPRSKSLRVA